MHVPNGVSTQVAALVLVLVHLSEYPHEQRLHEVVLPSSRLLCLAQSSCHFAWLSCLRDECLSGESWAFGAYPCVEGGVYLGG